MHVTTSDPVILSHYKPYSVKSVRDKFVLSSTELVDPVCVYVNQKDKNKLWDTYSTCHHFTTATCSALSYALLGILNGGWKRHKSELGHESVNFLFRY